MSTTLTLYVYTKNLNLHAVSALEAIRDLLNEKDVVAINRFIRWELTFDTDRASALAQLESFLESSFHILNPNKEDYYLDHIQGLSSQLKHRFVCVERDIDKNQSSLLHMMNDRFEMTLTAIKKSIVWHLSLEKESDVEAILDKVVASTSYEKGVLVNPIYESYDIVSQL